MPRHEMILSPNYVSSWGLWDAMRELYQNCLDQGDETITYNSTQRQMVFENKDCTIPKKTLLLGESVKKAGSRGFHGEGYKIAFLVLTRLGKEITVENGHETWKPKIIKSKRYGTDLLVVDTKKHLKSYKNLRFIVDNIGSEEFRDISSKVLFTDYGLLKDKEGQIFDGGLYICTNDGFKHGYNFPPRTLPLDRDRNKVPSFDLEYATSKTWAKALADGAVDYSEFKEMCYKYKSEVYYVGSWLDSKKPLVQDVMELMAEDFLAKHGKYAVAVEDMEEASVIRKKYQNAVPVVMPKAIRETISLAPSYKARFHSGGPIVSTKTPNEWLSDWYADWQNKYGSKMVIGMQEELEKLIEKSKEWRNA